MATCFHPGFVATGFNHNNGPILSLAMTFLSLVSRKPDKGAETLVWLATAPDAIGTSGGYFVDRRLQAPSAAAQDDDTARAQSKPGQRLTAKAANCRELNASTAHLEPGPVGGADR